MKPLRILAPAALALALTSCAANRSESYDTPSANYPADASMADSAFNEPANPVYDTPAAYEENSDVPSTQTSPNLPAPPATAARPTAPARPGGAAIVHTVVSGDTLSGISVRYKVPAASIKQANGMTRDIVVLGKKMVIPPN